MTIAKEFPDFPAADLPAIPEGFVDTSWHNDSCPTFRNEARDLMIGVDYLDPAKREFPEIKRFSLQTIEGCDIIVESDDWNDILHALETKVWS